MLRCDVWVRDGLITGVTAAGSGTSEAPRIELQGAMLWPCFADLHTHIDKGHIWRRAPGGDGSPLSAPSGRS